VPVVVCAAFISWFSTDAFSARSTHNYIDPVLRLLFGDLSLAGMRLAHAVVRKLAHLTEYALLGSLLCRALAEPGAQLRLALLARVLLYCGLYASADELHQTFVMSRTGSPVDVGIDVAGAGIGALLFVWRRGRALRASPGG